jgi:pantothenate kinase
VTRTPRPATAESSAPVHGAADTDVLPDDPALLADRIRGLRSGGRMVFGIVGAPGSGKSALSALVLAHLTSGPDPVAAALVPMDGYHLAQHIIEAAGTAQIKGAPVTFDGAGYVSLLRRLVTPTPGETVYAPEFRRAIEEPIAGSVAVGPDIEVVITEGNYLLLAEPPWAFVEPLLTETWYLDVPEQLRLDRLVSRHIAFGRTPEVAMLRSTSGTDGRNAATVLATRGRADLLIRPR